MTINLYTLNSVRQVIMLFTSTCSYFHSSLALLYSYYGKTILWSSPTSYSVHTLFISVAFNYHLFLSQTADRAADPPLSKAKKVVRLQLAYKPGSSSSQRWWVLWVTHWALSPDVTSRAICILLKYFTLRATGPFFAVVEKKRAAE